jgi:hypothetical protein
MKCYVCKTPVTRMQALPFWVVYRGYERPHCSQAHQVMTIEKKTKEAAAALGSLGGKSTSEAKRKASAENGKLGGRPKSQTKGGE